MIRKVAAIIIAALACAAPARAEPAPPCADAAHRALDFWLGEWDAYRADTNALAGRSSIKLEDQSCVVTEHWTSVRSSFSGRSLNLYDAASGHWRQFWADSQGDLIDFTGEIIDGGVRFTAAGDVEPDDPAPHFTRMTLTRNADGSVHQLGEASPDGQAWSVRYDFIYRPHRG